MSTKKEAPKKAVKAKAVVKAAKPAKKAVKAKKKTEGPRTTKADRVSATGLIGVTIKLDNKTVNRFAKVHGYGFTKQLRDVCQRKMEADIAKAKIK